MATIGCLWQVAGHIAVSIHAPGRGATVAGWSHDLAFAFQSTRPRRGATRLFEVYSKITLFQSTRPRSLRPGLHRFCFKPRARARRDVALSFFLCWLSWFQSTRPRGARLPPFYADRNEAVALTLSLTCLEKLFQRVAREFGTSRQALYAPPFITNRGVTRFGMRSASSRRGKFIKSTDRPGQSCLSLRSAPRDPAIVHRESKCANYRLQAPTVRAGHA